MARRVQVRGRPRGIVLILTMIMLVVFASLAISMTTLSDMNLQMADNQRCGNSADPTKK